VVHVHKRKKEQQEAVLRVPEMGVEYAAKLSLDVLSKWEIKEFIKVASLSLSLLLPLSPLPPFPLY
jgi:hypothetical protein